MSCDVEHPQQARAGTDWNARGRVSPARIPEAWRMGPGVSDAHGSTPADAKRVAAGSGCSADRTKAFMNIYDKTDKLAVSNADLSDSHFTDVSLHAAHFTDVNLSKATFTDIDLSDSKFRDVNFSNVAIDDCNVTGMTIRGVLVTDLFAAYEKPT